jgi:hypothetical protein
MPCKQGFSDWRSRLHYICTTINQWAVCISQKNCNSSEASQPASQLLVPISPTTVEAKKKNKIRDGWRCKLWLIAANSLTHNTGLMIVKNLPRILLQQNTNKKKTRRRRKLGNPQKIG